MRRIPTLLAACGLAFGMSMGFAGTIRGLPAAGAAGIPATAGGWTVLGAENSLPTLSQPAGLAVDARGNVYVADTGNHRIVEIAPDGRLLAHFGDADLRPQGASSLAVSAGGTVYAADAFHRAILVYSPGHRRIASWPISGAPVTQLAVAVGGRRTVIVAFAPESRCTIQYGPPACATTYIVQRRAPSGRLLGQFRTPVAPFGEPNARVIPPPLIVTQLAVTVNPAGDISVAAGGTEPCYKDCLVYHFLIEHAPGGRVLGHWGKDQLDVTASWAAVAAGGRGNVFLADDLSHRIEKRAPGGRVLARWPVGTLFPDPQECTLGQNGSNILRLSLAGGQLGLIHLGYFGPGSGIAVDAHENVTIAYGTPPHFERYSSSGTLIASWGAPKPALVQWGFPSPAGITLDAAGDSYIADTLRNVVKEYGPGGTLMHAWGSAGSYAGQFHHPGGIAVAPDGAIYVSDTENHRVQRLLR